ncbi:hypothetical protein B5F13_03205 [Drancourtella sp. An177]|nr:sigma-70 family RNA polymerase sigma factor [uncultured Sellimonas sp.]OUP66732.1 hypothetical protein B5F13_03205 [Drancourtella sp. An177]
MNEIRFNDIYKNYVDLALKTAVYYCKDKTAAEDIVQLAFAKLYVNYDEIRNKEAIGAWLITTIRYLAFSQGRKMNREIPTEDCQLRKSMNEDTVDAEEVIFMEERRKQTETFAEDLLKAVYEHNPRWYDAVLKAYVLDMPQKTIADEMGIRLEAFQSILFRARQWIIRKYETQYRKIE